MRRLLLLLLCVVWLPAISQQRIDLAGEWTLRYDQQQTTILLPGTMDTNKKGHSIEKKDETTHLSRLYSFKGKACYEREVVIPKAWKKQPLTLFLERTKPTWLYVDGQLMDSCHHISTPQRYQLKALKPGKHIIRIVIDNGSGVPEQLYASSLYRGYPNKLEWYHRTALSGDWFF